MRSIVSTLLITVALFGGTAQADELKPFRSDGCSLFPDDSKILRTDWCDCCVVHDRAYWLGGTTKERRAADEKFRDCVATRTGNRVFADILYNGVRLGGSPYFYNWYRWGYGWPYDRGYQAVTLEEQQLANQLVGKDKSENADVCKDD